MLYQHYILCKSKMEEVNPPGTKNEQYLWHGTSHDAIDSICDHGFMLAYAGYKGK